jgi:hypothetical protein
MNDTICAISTAVGIGAISIVRISGDESIDIVNKIFDKDLNKIKSHTINYGHIIDNNEIIDEVMLSVMKAPKTFTREDIVEINSKELFKIKSREKLITELFLQNYIIYNSDVLIIVVGILTYSEQKLLNKIKIEIGKSKIDKQIYIIHNLMNDLYFY